MDRDDILMSGKARAFLADAYKGGDDITKCDIKSLLFEVGRSNHFLAVEGCGVVFGIDLNCDGQLYVRRSDSEDTIQLRDGDYYGLAVEVKEWFEDVFSEYDGIFLTIAEAEDILGL